MFTVLANMVLQCFHKFLKFCRGQHFFAEEQAVKRIMDRGCWKQDRGSPVVYFSTGAIPAGFFFCRGGSQRGTWPGCANFFYLEKRIVKMQIEIP